jgi:hypothetical protein
MPNKMGIMERTCQRTNNALIAGAFLAVLAVSFATLAISPISGGTVETPTNSHNEIAPLASSLTIASNGIGPTTLSLDWTESGDFCFDSYALQYSLASSNGPWTVYNVITAKATVWQYANGLTPATASWWQVVDNSGCGGGSQASNTLQVEQTAASTLSFTQPTSTSAQFTWDNNAQYGGNVTFGSYELMESVSGGGYASATTITTQATTDYTLNGLSSGTGYSFYLLTTDQCMGYSGCGAPSSSSSNVISFGTTVPLSASATAKPSAVDTGQLLSFSCSAGGGVAPYNYSWTFGNGATGSGQNPSYSYNSQGIQDAVCTVRDNSGDSATSPVTVAVDPAPTVNLPTASSNPVDTGQSVTFSVSATQGAGGLDYNWSGLPSGCVSVNAPTLTCIPSAPGTLGVVVAVHDSNDGSATSPPLSMTVFGTPTVSTPTASAGSIDVGQSVTFTANATQGSGNLSYIWLGLPSGCVSVNAKTVTCSPSASGTSSITVAVRDSDGGTATSLPLSFTVNTPPSTMFLGMPQAQGYALIVVAIAILACVAAAALILSRRKRRKGSSQPTPSPSAPPSENRSNPPNP